jgi:hypothetical protein
METVRNIHIRPDKFKVQRMCAAVIHLYKSKVERQFMQKECRICVFCSELLVLL